MIARAGCALLSAFLLPVGTVGAQQPFGTLADSCFYYMAVGDTLRFDRLYPNLTAAYEQSVDSENYALRQELLAMRNSDQGIRLLLLEARKRFGTNSPTAATLHARMKRIDETNARRVCRLIDRYGWRGKEEIGEEANEALFLCIQHVDDPTVQEKYLPMLRQAVEEGRAEGWHYAFLIDRIRMNRGEKQIYGTQTISRNGALDYVVPLENPDKVDSLRQSVGLKPMNAYLDGAWDLNAYKRDLPRIEQKYKAFTAARKTTE